MLALALEAFVFVERTAVNGHLICPNAKKCNGYDCPPAANPLVAAMLLPR